MKYKNTFFLLFFSLFSCSSLKEVSDNEVVFGENSIVLEKSNQMPFTGVVIKHYPDGKIQSKKTYKDGLADGPLLQWDQNGQLRMHFEYKNNKRRQLRSWYGNGALLLEADFSEEKAECYQILYYRSGQKYSEWRWNNKTGLQTLKEWLEDGRLIAEGTMERFGKNKNGSFTDWSYEIPLLKFFSDGKLISIKDFNGTPVDINTLRKKTPEELANDDFVFGFNSEFE